MWSLFKSLVFLGGVAFLAYFVMFVPVGGATLAAHGQEIWSSAVVQGKVQKVRTGIHDELAQKLAATSGLAPGTPGTPGTPRGTTASKASKATRANHSSTSIEISESDRQALSDLLATSLTK